MEFKKITICRQDVVVVSDTEPDKEPGNNKKKKYKTKIECVRKVQLTNIMVNRVVPFCNRQRCRNIQNHNRNRKNTKHMETRNPRKDSRTSRKRKVHCKQHRKKEKTVPRELYSPITVKSSSGTYEDISECSFHLVSSDSDEIEELIKTTRKRMRDDPVQFNNRNRRTSFAFSTVTSDENYERISMDDETYNSSLHSMDTIVLKHEVPIPSPPITPKNFDDENIVKKTSHNVITTLIRSKNFSNNNNNDFDHQPSSQSSQDNQGEQSPVYEISGKALMEHYLNTSVICSKRN